MATLSPDPNWWHNDKTKIEALSTSGGVWWVRLIHGDINTLVPTGWLYLHINGWAVYLNWIDVTKKIKKRTRNVLQYNSKTWVIERVEILPRLTPDTFPLQMPWKQYPEDEVREVQYKNRSAIAQFHTKERIVRAIRSEHIMERYTFSLISE
jgi:hypothetical protein